MLRDMISEPVPSAITAIATVSELPQRSRRAPDFVAGLSGTGAIASGALALLTTPRAATARPAGRTPEGEALIDPPMRAEGLRALIERLPVGFFRCVVGNEGLRIIEANPALIEMLGYESRDQLLASPVEALYESFQQVPVADVPAGSSTAPVDVLVRTRQGRTLIARVRYEVSAAETGPLEYIGIVENLTDQRHAEEAAATSGLQLASFFEHANVGMSVIDLDMRLIDVNPALCRILGYSDVELLGRRHDDLVHPAERGIDTAVFNDALNGINDRRYLAERRLIASSGETVWVRLVAFLVRDHEGLPLYSVGIHEDITELKQADEDLADEVWERARVAAALSNLRAGQDIEATAANICRALMDLHNVDMACVYDLSNGDAIPLALRTPPGAPVRLGQPLPRSRARELRTRAKQGPWVKIWGEGGNRDERSWKATGIKASAYVPLTWEGRVVGMLVAGSTSSESPQAATRWLSSLIEYGAVASALLGGGLVLRRQAALTRGRVLQLMAEQRYRPVFQPVVELATGRVVGFEALTRFADGQSPEGWFRTATEVGLGADLQEACLRVALQAAEGLAPGWLSVNLSPGLVGEWDRIAGCIPERPIVIEVTEDEAIDDYQTLRDRVAGLHGEVELAVDDAGAGFASLRHIIELRPQYVKLAMHIVRDVDTDPARQAMVAGMVHFARQTGCQIIAEGIETDAERASLNALGVHLGQGYLLGRPAPAGEFALAA